jgi:hypothetical protein
MAAQQMIPAKIHTKTTGNKSIITNSKLIELGEVKRMKSNGAKINTAIKAPVIHSTHLTTLSNHHSPLSNTQISQNL